MYTVELARSAARELRGLPAAVQRRVTAKICALAREPRPRGVAKIKKRNLYRIRIGNHRILYKIDDKNTLVAILSIGHRREVYR